MDFGSAFTYPFKDPDWVKKVLITALITLIPVVGSLYQLGWMIEITRKVIRREDPLMLPETNFGAYLGDGFKSLIIGLVYALPLILFTVPISIVSTLTSSNSSGDTSAYIIIAVSLCCGGLAFIYAILMAFMLPAAQGNFAAKGNIGDGLRFAEVFRLVRAAPVAYLIVLVGIIIGGFIAPLGAIACGIGVLVTIVYANMISAHFYGQAYNQALRQ